MVTLIVEDDLTTQKVMEMIVSSFSESDIATDGQTALKAFEEAHKNGRHYDLILLDILMPEMDGHIVLSKIREYEKNICNESKRDLFHIKEPKAQLYDIYYTILEEAWNKDNDITEDEENILKTLRKKMKISLEEHWILQAKFGIFPKPPVDKDKNEFHTADEINSVLRSMQTEHLLLLILDQDKEKSYVIPEEIADVVKQKWDIQLSRKAYESLLENKKYFYKERYLRIIEAAGIKPKGWTNKELVEDIIKNVKPKEALLSFVPTNEVQEELGKMCINITGKKGSSKNDRIERIFHELDQLSHQSVKFEDPREIYFKYFEELAARNSKKLRDLKIIEKDLDMEKAFEEGTRYIFEKIFMHKLEKMDGTDHPDGMIKIDDNRYLLWDNKSKETSCNLKNHLDQFHRYIRRLREHNGDVQSFLVIAPEFDQKSEIIAHGEKMKNITFTLVRAQDLKIVAEEWKKANAKKQQFPLSIFNISGRVDIESLKNAFNVLEK